MAAKKVVKKKAAKAKSNGSFKLTYATMFNPPESMHTAFDKAVVKVHAGLGKDIPMLINGQDRFIEAKFDDRSPINTDWLLGTFQKGGVADGQDALNAARAAVPVWANMKWKDRVRIMRKAAAQIEKRLYEISAVVSLEIGKNRMEALGDVQETADLIYYYCDEMERNNGYIVPMRPDPLAGFTSSNVSILKPYGVWVVISPFNFPFALAGGPTGAALVAGNTVVFKPASDTPYSGRLLAECIRDAGVPDGAFNYVTGGGAGIAVQSAQDRLSVATAAVDMAEESLRIIQNRYDAGLTTVTELLRNEAALLDARTRKLKATYDVRIARIQLEYAAGSLQGDSNVLK